MAERQQPSVEPRDVFDLLRIGAQEMDFEAAKRDQKHPDRRNFIDDLVTYLANYNRENGVIKPKGYYEQVKMVASSRTAELFVLVEALRGNDFKTFVAQMKLLDLEVLRRMGKLPEEESRREDLPSVLKGKHGFSGDILAARSKTAEDVRSAAARQRNRHDWN